MSSSFTTTNMQNITYRKSPFITVIIALHVLLPASASAQARYSLNSVRSGDVLDRCQISLFSLGTKGDSVVWDISDISVINDKEETVYVAADDEPEIIAEYNNTLYNMYTNKGDSVLLNGYGDSNTKVNLSIPEIIFCGNMSSRDIINGVFHGSAVYSERIMARIYGAYTLEQDAAGIIILPDNDTLVQVRRVHTKKHIKEERLPQIKSEKDLSVYVDSICKYNNDSIRHRLYNDIVPVEQDIYRWYAEGYRYPILETIITGFLGKNPKYIAAYYYPPEGQEKLDDEENKEIRKNIASDKISKVGEYKNGNDILLDYSVSVNGKNITIDCTLEENATIKALVCDVRGIVYKSTSDIHVEKGFYSTTIDCGSLRNGNYVLYLNVNGDVYHNKVMLK